MSDHDSRNDRRLRADYAAQMARAEFGRHYVDPDRLEQTLKNGEIVLRQKPRRRRDD
jgi:hypothetical protein